MVQVDKNRASVLRIVTAVFSNMQPEHPSTISQYQVVMEDKGLKTKARARAQYSNMKSLNTNEVF